MITGYKVLTLSMEAFEIKTNVAELKSLLDQLEDVLNKINDFELKIIKSDRSVPELAQ